MITLIGMIRIVDRPYWETYREYLKNDKQFSPDAVSALDKTTDIMMKNIERS